LRVASGVSRLLLFGLGLLVALSFAPAAKADALDFSCGSGTCTGIVVQSGSNFSSNGIGLTANFEGDQFSLVFDTSNAGLPSSIQLMEGGAADFVGTITGFSSSTDSGTGLTQVNLSAVWFPLPSDVNGSAGVTPFSSVISLSISNNTLQALSVDVPIVTPEPATPMLLSAGLLGLGFLLKRKAFSLA